MRPLTPDDLLPLGEYAARRREFFESHCRYLDRYRRVRIGPRLTLLFENRQTLWFRVQEVLRIARLADLRVVQQELDVFNRLLPDRDHLQAALVIAIDDESKLTEELAFWNSLRGDDLRLRLNDACLPAQLLTCRPEDRCTGMAHWVTIHVPPLCRKALADPRKPARFESVYATYPHESPPLSDDVRQSLLEDLQLSDRDA